MRTSVKPSVGRRVRAEASSGNQDQDLQRWAEAVGVPYQTALQYRWVARQFENSNRLENLSFKHHLLVAAREDRQELLKMAADIVNLKNLILGEYDENIHRKDFLPTELVATARLAPSFRSYFHRATAGQRRSRRKCHQATGAGGVSGIGGAEAGRR